MALSKTIKFFVAALPRSGTLWTSAYLSANGLPCVHEFAVSGGLGGWVGASGSDCVANCDQLINGLPKAKWIIIEREVEDSVESFGRIFPGIDRGAISEYFHYLKRQLAEIKGLRIPFTELFTQVQLKRISAFLDFEHNAALAEQFIHSKIELHPKYLTSWESTQQ